MVTLTDDQVAALRKLLTRVDLREEPALRELLRELTPVDSELPQATSAPTLHLRGGTRSLEDEGGQQKPPKPPKSNKRKRRRLANEDSDSEDDGRELEDDLTIRGVVEQGVNDAGLRWIIVDMAAKEDDPHADEILQLLLAGAESTLDHPRCTTWVAGLRELYQEMFWADEGTAFKRDAFRCLVMRCQRSLAVRGAIDLTVMVNLVQLVVKVDSIRKAHNINTGQIYAEYMASEVGAPSLRTFQSWISAGQKYAALASSEANKAAGNIIRNRLLPLMGHLARQIPLSMSSLFSRHLLDALGLPRTLHCSDLHTTDKFFCAINQLDFKQLDRDWSLWAKEFPSKGELASLPMPTQFASLQRRILSASSATSSATSSGASTPFSTSTPLSASTPLSDSEDERSCPAPIMVDDDDDDDLMDSVISICTGFNKDHQDNLKYELLGSDATTVFQWTQQQRVLAQQAAVPETLEALETALKFLYNMEGLKQPSSER
ncbi:hypothetical protein GSI_00693 [Ganoderma sinense ZZ0214-1]|uniref:Uncharacterized protein n=1 Tax=Ganoderma sinense ZZ0214-1 TaxID=1077348 RepID=A0A2G8ST94_9APHY|nr:hypothetical protein GSI_00693 [Ganoderma sinense ZZ0214-1]